MKTKTIILSVTLIIAVVLAAGCSNKLMRQANRHYQNEEFVTAAATYERVLQEENDDDTVKAMLNLADCYRHMNRYADAEHWYSRAINEPGAKPADKLHYAEVLKAQGKCEEANIALDEYLRVMPADGDARKMREACQLALEMPEEESYYAVKRIYMGVIGSSFSPSYIVGDQLIVSANVPRSDTVPLDERTGDGFNDLYLVNVENSEMVAMETPQVEDPNGGLLPSESGGTEVSEIVAGEYGPKHRAVTITSLGDEINSEYHEGAAVIAPSGTEMYFTRSKLKNDRPVTSLDNENHLELCKAELVDGKWTNVEPLPFNRKDYSVGHPAITSDGQRLYFTSDMPGGHGGTDIYYADMQSDGEWSRPKNAGTAVNTSGDEMFPYVRKVPDGKDVLYFSSNGLPAAENLDIYKAELDKNDPGKPVRLGKPFNTTYDDFGVMYNPDGMSGYFSSDRANDAGKDHVYAFRQRPAFFFVKADVFFTGTKEPVQDIDVEVRNLKTGMVDTMNTEKMGGIFFPADSITDYSFAVRKEGYFAGVGTVNVGGFEGKLMDTAYVQLFMDEIVINKPIRLENIYYDFDKWNIRPDAAIELDKLVKILKDNPTIKIELGSHCDARGSHAYNDRLSQRRAQSAVNYIVSKGISSDRITAKGYGETVPLNRCVDDVECTEEEHQWNRRTEFKVTEITGGQQVLDSQPAGR